MTETEELERLAASITPGPWWTDAEYDGSEKGCAIIAARTDCGPLPGNPTRGMVAWSNALLNTEARRCEANASAIALVPELLAEVIALRAEVEQLTVAHDTVCGALAEAVKRVTAAEADADWLAGAWEDGWLHAKNGGLGPNPHRAQRVNAKDKST